MALFTAAALCLYSARQAGVAANGNGNVENAQLLLRRAGQRYQSNRRRVMLRGPLRRCAMMLPHYEHLYHV